jgi:hypothetical protein
MSKVITPLNTPNKTQNFYPADDNWELRQMPFAASVAIEEGTAVSPQIATNNVTGNLTKMGTENATGSDFFGIIAESVVSTDSDYATAGKLKGVWVPKSTLAKAYFTVGAGTFTLADVFKTVEIHSDSKSLAVDTLGKGARIVEYISATRGVCRFSLPETEVA